MFAYELGICESCNKWETHIATAFSDTKTRVQMHFIEQKKRNHFI